MANKGKVMAGWPQSDVGHTPAREEPTREDPAPQAQWEGPEETGSSAHPVAPVALGLAHPKPGRGGHVYVPQLPRRGASPKRKVTFGHLR